MKRRGAFATNRRDRRLHAEVSHRQRILHDETVDFTRIERLDEALARIEADKLLLTREASTTQSEQHSVRRRFVRTKDTVDIGVSSEQILARLLRHGTGRAREASRVDEFHAVRLLHRVGKTCLSFNRARRTFLIPQHQCLALATEKFRETRSRNLATYAIVGGDETGEVLTDFRIEAGIDDDHGNAATHREPYRIDERLVVERGEDDGIDAAGDEVFDKTDLVGAIVFATRPLPDDFDVAAEFALSLHGARVDGFPKLVGRSLRNDGDTQLLAVLPVATAGREK